MKKIILSIALLGFISVGHIQAQSNETKAEKATAQQQLGNFVDSNKDGVCDNFEQRQKNMQGQFFKDENKDGVCDNAGERRGRGQGLRGKGQRRNCQGTTVNGGRNRSGRGFNQSSPETK